MRDPAPGRRRRRPGDRPARRADPGRRAGRRGPVDGRSVGADRRVAAVDKGPGDPVFTGHDQPVRRDRGPGREGRPRDDVRPGAPAGRRRRSGARPPLERTADRLARYFLPVVEIVAGADAAGRLPAGLARRLVADGGRAGRRLPVRAGAGDAGRDAREHGLAGPARRPDQGGPALERLAACDTFAFDKTGTLTAGQARAREPRRRSAGAIRGRPAPPGRVGRGGEPAPAGRRRRRRGRTARARRRCRPPTSTPCPARGSQAACAAPTGTTHPTSSSATAGCWPSTGSRSTTGRRGRS